MAFGVGETTPDLAGHRPLPGPKSGPGGGACVNNDTPQSRSHREPGSGHPPPCLATPPKPDDLIEIEIPADHPCELCRSASDSLKNTFWHLIPIINGVGARRPRSHRRAICGCQRADHEQKHNPRTASSPLHTNAQCDSRCPAKGSLCLLDISNCK